MGSLPISLHSSSSSSSSQQWEALELSNSQINSRQGLPELDLNSEIHPQTLSRTNVEYLIIKMREPTVCAEPCSSTKTGPHRSLEMIAGHLKGQCQVCGHQHREVRHHWPRRRGRRSHCQEHHHRHRLSAICSTRWAFFVPIKNVYESLFMSLVCVF